MLPSASLTSPLQLSGTHLSISQWVGGKLSCWVLQGQAHTWVDHRFSCLREGSLMRCSAQALVTLVKARLRFSRLPKEPELSNRARSASWQHKNGADQSQRRAKPAHSNRSVLMVTHLRHAASAPVLQRGIYPSINQCSGLLWNKTNLSDLSIICSVSFFLHCWQHNRGVACKKRRNVFNAQAILTCFSAEQAFRITY